jgi:uncharacterized protein YbcI
MTTETELKLKRPADGTLPSAISTAIVMLMREYTGRGAMRAQTTIRGNVVLVMLEQTLTKGEQVLVKKGRSENVLALRREYQEAMREESSEKITELTGRDVTAMMSANHLSPDLAAEIYILTGPPDLGRATADRADPRLDTELREVSQRPASTIRFAQSPSFSGLASAAKTS